jgi:ABC-type branched-subunit amino acid transport system permease subunit
MVLQPFVCTIITIFTSGLRYTLQFCYFFSEPLDRPAPALWLWYYLLMLVIVGIIFVCLRLQHSRSGRAWHADL